MTLFAQLTPCGTCGQKVPARLLTAHTTACNETSRNWRDEASCALCGFPYQKAQWKLHEKSTYHQNRLKQGAAEKGDRLSYDVYGEALAGALLRLPDVFLEKAPQGQSFVLSLPRLTKQAVVLLLNNGYTLRGLQTTARTSPHWAHRDDSVRAVVVIALYLADHMGVRGDIPEWMDRELWSMTLVGRVSPTFGQPELVQFFKSLSHRTDTVNQLVVQLQQEAREAVREYFKMGGAK